MKRVLVLGAAGMAGHMLSLVLRAHGFDVTPLARKQVPLENLKCLDVQTPEFDVFLQSNSFDVVINCIGVLNQFAERNVADAIYLNSYFPHHLEQVFAQTPCKVIHISTDCVFSGNKGRYIETDIPDADTVYARTKALGEIHNAKDLTLRTSIIGPDLSSKGIGLLNWFLHQRDSVSGYQGAIWSGVTTLQLAKVIVEVLKSDVSGLYHLTPDGSISKYEILSIFKEQFNKPIEIVPLAEPRIDKSLIDSRRLFSVPGYAQMFAELAEWTKQRKDLYPHYFVEV